MKGSVIYVRPTTLSIQSTATGEPVKCTYTYSKATAYMDDTDQPVAVSSVKSGVAVSVRYVCDAGRLVATCVVVHTRGRKPVVGTFHAG